jgi:23S rRNA pseudouridine2605 synthase
MSPDEPASPRLQKYLADRGIASRRAAEAWIADGQVRVNGVTAHLGQRVNPHADVITVRGKPLPPDASPRVTLVMNKPRRVVCTNRDPLHPADDTVFALLPRQYHKLRLYCAGRLDKDSEGLLLLTNDGELSQRLTHPSGGVVKRYHVTVHRDFNPALIPRLLHGIMSEGEHLRALKVIPAQRGPNPARRLEIHLDQGHKREIRRLLEAFGYYVDRLRRFQIGSFVLRQLAPGQVRLVTPKEKALLLAQPALKSAPSRNRPALARRPRGSSTINTH